MKTLFVAVCYLLVIHQSVQGESCPTCIHISYKLSGLPALYKAIIQSTLDNLFTKLNLTNPACITGTAAAQTCSASPVGLFMVNKCQETQTTIKAKGLSIFDTAENEATVVIKGCMAAPRGEADKCTLLDEMDEATRDQFTVRLAAMKQLWNTVTYSGRVCLTTPQ